MDNSCLMEWLSVEGIGVPVLNLILLCSKLESKWQMGEGRKSTDRRRRGGGGGGGGGEGEGEEGGGKVT
jgi:hypothetical protein